MSAFAGLETEEHLSALSDGALEDLVREMAVVQEQDRKENQLLYYKPVSERAALVHESRARYVGVGGGNRCLPLDAPVLMADGSWRALGQLRLGETVMAADPESGATRAAPVTAVWRSGVRPVYRVTFSDGGGFEATAEHEVPLYLGSGRKTSKGYPKKPLKRRLGDYIEPIMRRGARNPSKRISATSPGDLQFGQAKLPLHPYLLGALLGDGGLSRSHLKFFNADEAVIERVRTHLQEIGCVLVRYSQYDYGITNKGQEGSQRPPSAGPNRLRFVLQRLNLLGHTAHTKFLPPEVFGLDREARKQVLAGLIDTDGTTDSFCSASPRLARDFTALIRSLGGKATMGTQTIKAVNGAQYTATLVYWRLNERLPLSIPRKQATNSKREVDYRRRICRGAELVGLKECGDIEVGDPWHCYVTGDYVIVSNSAKTETCIVHAIALATGVFPRGMEDTFARQFRGPINVRIVVESHTAILQPVILPKLQWWQWSGDDRPGGARGHWGWIPKTCLKGGEWSKSWSEQNRLLRILCRDPTAPERILGESMIQMMSSDQLPQKFASAQFHLVILDEKTDLAIFRENEARVMSVDGRIFLAMTWPDDPSIPVDWIYDEIYEKAQPGPKKSPDHDWFELWTTDNRYINQEAVAAKMGTWSEATQSVRIYGKPVRFSNRIHPLFTDIAQAWCHTCHQTVMAREEGIKTLCPHCGGSNLADYCHVQEFDWEGHWPVVFLLDPHPRKPHMFLWVGVDPQDDLWVIADSEVEDGVPEVRVEADLIEGELSLNVALRLIDPNMGRSPANAVRGVTWQDEFDAAGLYCELADDSDIGRSRINDYLKPDDRTLRPRLHVHPRARGTVHQMLRYTWGEHRRSLEKELKQKPRDKYDDYPSLLRYCLNYDPQFTHLRSGPEAKRWAGTRRGAY